MKKSIELTFSNSQEEDFLESWTIKAVNENGFDKVTIYRDASGVSQEWTVLTEDLLWDKPEELEAQLTRILYGNIQEITASLGMKPERWDSYIEKFKIPSLPESAVKPPTSYGGI